MEALSENPHIKTVVGHGIGGSVALELQTRHPELMLKTYSAPAVDLKGAIQPTWNTKAERYRNLGDPTSLFGTSTHTTAHGEVRRSTNTNS